MGILIALNVSFDFVFCDVVRVSLKQKACLQIIILQRSTDYYDDID